MNILNKIKELTDTFYNPQPTDQFGLNPQGYSSGLGWANPARGQDLQGSLGGYAQPRTQFQGGQVPDYSGPLSVQQPNYGQIRQPYQGPALNLPAGGLGSISGLEIDNGLKRKIPQARFKPYEYLPYK